VRPRVSVLTVSMGVSFFGMLTLATGRKARA
jgi:hypothetical protein